MKINSILLSVLLPFTLLPNLFGDSCLTSTNFWQAYEDLPIVATAAESGKIDDSIAAYLKNPENPIGTKMAVCNALGWSFDGKNNHLIFLRHLGLNFAEGKIIRTSDLAELSSEELLCVGYLMALDNYFYPERAKPIVEKASLGLAQSYAAQVIQSLVLGQIRQHQNNWCEVWNLLEDVKQHYPKEQRDLREPASEIILDYISLYEKYCDQN